MYTIRDIQIIISNIMQKIFFLTSAILICFSISVNGQDIITTKKGEDIQSKVMEITLSELKYKNFNNLNGPLISILKSDVLMIRYENGTKDIFRDENLAPSGVAIKGENENYKLGQQDARRYYKGYRAAGTGTLVTGLVLSPLLGLVPAFATTSAVPQEINLNYPDPKRMKNADYSNGYLDQSFKIKKSKVWTNLGISVGVNVLVYLALKR
jgi:hypothetical protein